MLRRWGSPVPEIEVDGLGLGPMPEIEMGVVGLVVGLGVGLVVGLGVGLVVGLGVGLVVGLLVGTGVGALKHGVLSSLAKNLDGPPITRLRPPPEPGGPRTSNFKKNSLVLPNSTMKHRFAWSTISPFAQV
jgi:hypothetical protein